MYRAMLRGAAYSAIFGASRGCMGRIKRRVVVTIDGGRGELNAIAVDVGKG